MIVDCDGCAARGPACSDCVVSVLLGVPVEHGGPVHVALGPRRPGDVRSSEAARHHEEGAGQLLEVPDGGLDESERAALGVLADAGLVAPLRLVPVPSRAAASADDRAGHRHGVRPAAYASRRGTTRAG